METSGNFIENLTLDKSDNSRLSTDVVAVKSEGSLQNFKSKKLSQSSVWLNNGSFVFLQPDIGVQHTSDLMDSILLAELSASSKYDKISSSKDWLQNLKIIFENIGWTIQDFSYSNYSIKKNSGLSLLDLLEQQLSSFWSKADLNCLKKAIGSLTSGVVQINNTPNLSILQSKNRKIGYVLTYYVQMLNGNLTMRFSAIHFNCRKVIEDPLKFRFESSNCVISCSSMDLTLNDTVYNQLRSQIEQKLQGKTTKYLTEIPIDSELKS